LVGYICALPGCIGRSCKRHSRSWCGRSGRSRSGCSRSGRSRSGRGHREHGRGGHGRSEGDCSGRGGSMRSCRVSERRRCNRSCRWCSGERTSSRCERKRGPYNTKLSLNCTRGGCHVRGGVLGRYLLFCGRNVRLSSNRRGATEILWLVRKASVHRVKISLISKRLCKYRVEGLSWCHSAESIKCKLIVESYEYCDCNMKKETWV
jgi:hypothetical protein